MPLISQNPESVPVREWREVARERHVRAHEHSIATGHRQTHAFIMGITQADGKAASSISVAESRTRRLSSYPVTRRIHRERPRCGETRGSR
jgi:hypothetical protein